MHRAPAPVSATAPARPEASGSPVASEDVTRELVRALGRGEGFAHPVHEVQVLQTHISWVVLAGDEAYKIKKPLVLPFLDFGTLEARRRSCEDEIRLNRRTAPELYLDVVPIGGSPAAPRLGATPAIEYAVHMRRFPQDALLDAHARAGTLDARVVERLAARVAAMHRDAARAAPGSPHGSAATVLAWALANFDEMAPLATAQGEREPLARLRAWTLDEGTRLAPVFTQRQREGFVRECHGDLHLGNVVLLDGEPVPFDAIEFNEALRWIDVMADVAFVVMDLHDRRLPALASRFLDTYLQATGDYGGLAVLRFDVVYRAMVRAKVAAMRAAQQAAGDSRRLGKRDAHEHVALALAYAAPRLPRLVLMHGLSGSGKSTVAQAIADRAGMIRLRSDVERKRLAGLDAQAHSDSAIGRGLYAGPVSERTYAHLAALAGQVLRAGHSVVVDATFARRAERERFRALARTLSVPCSIVTCEAPLDILRERLRARTLAGADPSEATVEVLEHQLRTFEPLGDDERADAFVVATGAARDTVAQAASSLAAQIAAPDGPDEASGPGAPGAPRGPGAPDVRAAPPP